MPAPHTAPIFVALDTPTLAQATGLAAKLAESVGGLKLGLEFFTANGPKGVKEVSNASDLPIFLDLKFHDIPNTVAGAVRSTAGLGVHMITVHAGGGPAMLGAARAALDGMPSPPQLLAVTVLTSMDKNELAGAGITPSPAEQVLRLARLAQASGINGMVCSPEEVATLRKETSPGSLLVVPGIRPAGSDVGDQKRVATPAKAIAEGASLLVVGRPITRATDPAAAARAVLQEIELVSSATRSKN
jgi:orotidine-5'-phosphate decarboxylase